LPSDLSLDLLLNFENYSWFPLRFKIELRLQRKERRFSGGDTARTKGRQKSWIHLEEMGYTIFWSTLHYPQYIQSWDQGSGIRYQSLQAQFPFVSESHIQIVPKHSTPPSNLSPGLRRRYAVLPVHCVLPFFLCFPLRYKSIDRAIHPKKPRAHEARSAFVKSIRDSPES
jgi:hypothetical protein